MEYDNIKQLEKILEIRTKIIREFFFKKVAICYNAILSKSTVKEKTKQRLRKILENEIYDTRISTLLNNIIRKNNLKQKYYDLLNIFYHDILSLEKKIYKIIKENGIDIENFDFLCLDINKEKQIEEEFILSLKSLLSQKGERDLIIRNLKQRTLEWIKQKSSNRKERDKNVEILLEILTRVKEKDEEILKLI